MNKKIKQFVKSKNKKIGKEAINKITKMLENRAEEIIKNASRSADFAGRKIIKPEDIE